MSRDKSETICYCADIDYDTILKAIKQGAKTLEDIADKTDAGIACGYCIEELEIILEEEINK
jgi:nitrite reductase (NADH) large subunit